MSVDDLQEMTVLEVVSLVREGADPDLDRICAVAVAEREPDPQWSRDEALAEVLRIACETAE